MSKELNGSEIAGFVKERQAKAVRGLRQEWNIHPKLAIVRTNPDPVVDSYMKIKKNYGSDILVDVEVHDIDQSQALETIGRLNADTAVHGIIVQIPLPDAAQTDDVLNAVVSHKDVDGLAVDSQYDPPTPMAITWLLAAYGVELRGKKIVVIGKGRLVGAPLVSLWGPSKLDITVADRSTEDLPSLTAGADVIITATGVPELLRADMVKPGVIIVDAGVSTDSNGLVGDVAEDVRMMEDVVITPQKGGVGPLTVSALFENVISAARKSSNYSNAKTK